MIKEDLFALMKGQVIISCQAEPGEPLYNREFSLMPFMARAAREAGAKIIRTCSARDIAGIKEETGLPVIGVIRRAYPGYQGVNTVTIREVDECVEALADIISIDCTDNARGDSLDITEYIKTVKAKYPNITLMADIATEAEAAAAIEAGADLVGTCMFGETQATRASRGKPAFELVARLQTLGCPVVAEGNIHSPEDVAEMFRAGAWSVIVGSAVTRPQVIAKRFLAAAQEA